MVTKTMFIPKEDAKPEERGHALEFIAKSISSIDSTLQGIADNIARIQARLK